MSSLLDKIKLPETLRELSGKQLEQIAAEVREKIIEVTSKTGGHVAPSLGAVELAVALHASFESPKDKIIWDVGHQAYAHKILTGRLERFATIRQLGGISGFPKPTESPHDAFAVGHASTSISAALGMVKVRDLKGENNSIIAVIGDGSLSGGLAFEGVNNVDGMKSNMIVILNDNEMSISKNVGAYSNYLTRVAASDLYVDLRNRVERIAKKIPRFGTPLFQAAKKLKDRTKHLVVSFKVDVIFEELGFKYFGPIDGHNIPLIMSILHHARDVEGPVLVHVITKKGKGYPPAEKDPSRFHGTGPFNIKTGEPVNGQSKLTYTKVFGQTLAKLGEREPRIIGVTAAMIDGTGLEDFARKFPKRFFDVGIAEEHAITFAAGLAISGYRPVAAIYSSFLQRAYDQIIHDVCLQNLPVVFCLDRAGLVGEDGPTHHGLFDLAYLRLIPNMTVMAPKDENEFQHMLYTATMHQGPISLRYPRGSGPGVELESEFKQLEIGKGEVVFKSVDSRTQNVERRILLIAIGSMVYMAVEAAKLLEKEGIAAKVINARFVKPLDKELILTEAKSAGKVVTVEEGVLEGGFGSAVLELLTEEGISVPVKRIGLPSKFIEQGTRAELFEIYGLTAEKIF
ncbi:MAG: 1-deoxy-D-xylulose-5-phosphate synthase, partial [Candidatus Margulisbacteria bacterium]|nr:1-deoxy-D-xylulose-5-phosphate synthase [Candidatus Margulisiibacteriota bacterium]